jgi:hypothetical protein
MASALHLTRNKQAALARGLTIYPYKSIAHSSISGTSQQRVTARENNGLLAVEFKTGQSDFLSGTKVFSGERGGSRSALSPNSPGPKSADKNNRVLSLC